MIELGGEAAYIRDQNLRQAFGAQFILAQVVMPNLIGPLFKQPA